MVPGRGLRAGSPRIFRNRGEVRVPGDVKLRPLYWIVFAKCTIISQVDCDDAFNNLGDGGCVRQSHKEGVVGASGGD